MQVLCVLSIKTENVASMGWKHFIYWIEKHNIVKPIDSSPPIKILNKDVNIICELWNVEFIGIYFSKIFSST